MKINPCLCLTKQQKIVACTCKVTGINSALIVPAIAGYAFEYQHPLSYFSNCQGMIKQGGKYLAQLDQQVLAGLFISSYQHYDLLDLLELTAQEANAILCTASQSSLIEALELVPLFTQQNVVASPIFAMYWKGLQPQHDVNAELTHFVRRLAKDFKTPQASAEERKQMQITVLNKAAIDRRLNGGFIALSSAKHTMSDLERDFEEDFKEWKKEAKRLITALSQNSTLSPDFIKFLKSVNTDRNMITMPNHLRIRVAQKLTEKQHPDAIKLAKIITDCEPVEEQKELPPLNALQPEKKTIKSLREILADKRRQSQIMATSIEQVEDLDAAMQPLGRTLSIEEYDELVDTEEEAEEADGLEALDGRLNSFNASRSFGEDF